LKNSAESRSPFGPELKADGLTGENPIHKPGTRTGRVGLMQSKICQRNRLFMYGNYTNIIQFFIILNKNLKANIRLLNIKIISEENQY